MKAHLKLLMFIVILVISQTAKSQDVVGDWHGLLEMHDMQIRISLHVSQVEDYYVLTHYSPDESTTEKITADTIIIQGNNIEFKDVKYDFRYLGTISEKNTFIEGIFRQHGDSVLLSFGRHPLQSPKEY